MQFSIYISYYTFFQKKKFILYLLFWWYIIYYTIVNWNYRLHYVSLFLRHLWHLVYTAIMSLPVKRPLFEHKNSLNTSVKKSKVSPYDNQRKDKDNTPLSTRLAMPVGKSANKSLSSAKKEFDLVEKLFEEFKKKRQEEEERQSIKRDIEECSKELGNMKWN